MPTELRDWGTESFLYIQGPTGCAAFGEDGTDGEKVKLVTGLSVTNLDPSSGNPQTPGSISITIDPSTNGDIILSPKGTGETQLFNGSLNIQANNVVPTPGLGSGNLIMPDTTTAGLAGVIEFGGQSSAYRFIHNYGTNSTFVGGLSGNTSNTGNVNIGIGTSALTAITSGAGNVCVGNLSGTLIQSANTNTAVGVNSLAASVTGSSNVAIGNSALHLATGSSNVALGSTSLSVLTTGTSNIAVGLSSGGSFTTSESNNIVISNAGTIGDNNTIRIGTQGSGTRQQNKCFIAGVNGVSVTPAGTVVIDASGQLGTVAAIPISTPVTVPNGGTGQITLTNHGVLVGAGTAAVTQLSVGTNGQVLIGATGADPAFATLTSTGGTITFTPGANTLNLEGAPAFTWSVITADQTAAVNNGYICNKAGTLALALPTTSAAGAVIEVTGINTAAGWQVTQAAGQQIFFGTSSTTAGATGNLTSTNIRDSIKMVCVVANLTWNVLSSVGNITVT